MKFKVENGKTGEKWEGEALDAKDACREAGWPMSICWVRQEINGKWKNPEDKPELGKATRRFHGKKPDPEATPIAEEVAKGKAEPEEPAVEPAGEEPHEKEAGQEEENVEKEEVEPEGGSESSTAVSLGMPVVEQAAWENRIHIMQLARNSQLMFLSMGKLLYTARENADWSILHYETFREYCDDLGLPMQSSYSWATRLVGIFEYLVQKMNIPEEILIEIGVAKLTRLLPAAREGRLTMEMVDQAKILSDLDLREILGHNIAGDGGDEKPDFIVCPRCGDTFDARKATRVK